MWFYSDKPYKFSRPDDPIEAEDSAGYADYVGDAVHFLLAMAIAVIAAYALVMVFRPDVWRML